VEKERESKSEKNIAPNKFSRHESWRNGLLVNLWPLRVSKRTGMRENHLGQCGMSHLLPQVQALKQTVCPLNWS
jgi:hypothetical protein